MVPDDAEEQAGLLSQLRGGLCTCTAFPGLQKAMNKTMSPCPASISQCHGRVLNTCEVLEAIMGCGALVRGASLSGDRYVERSGIHNES
eukprot:5871875-Amphidinium_carterae.1